jgi:hypothetical protein
MGCEAGDHSWGSRGAWIGLSASLGEVVGAPWVERGAGLVGVFSSGEEGSIHATEGTATSHGVAGARGRDSPAGVAERMLGLSAAQGRSCGVALGRGVCGRCRGYLPREKPRCYGEVSLAANRSSSLSPVFPLHSLQAQPSCRPQAFPAGAALSYQRRCASISGFSPPFLSSLSLRSFGSGKGPDATRGAGGRLAAAQRKVWGRSGGPGGLGGFLGGGTGERYRQAKPGAQEFSGGRRLGRVGSLGDKAAKAAGRERVPKGGLRRGRGAVASGAAMASRKVLGGGKASMTEAPTDSSRCGYCLPVGAGDAPTEILGRSGSLPRLAMTHCPSLEFPFLCLLPARNPKLEVRFWADWPRKRSSHARSSRKRGVIGALGLDGETKVGRWEGSRVG